VKLKHIKIFEDFSQDQKAQSSETASGWTDIRDAAQMKRPFVIIVFRTRKSYLDALETELSDVDYIKQTATLVIDGNLVDYPSVFFLLDTDTDYSSKVKELYSEFEIKQIIVGEANEEYSTLYTQDGTSSDYGNEIMSSLSRDDFATEDHFKIGSTYYRFIEFNG
jgi:hypothetical protein